MGVMLPCKIRSPRAWTRITHPVKVRVDSQKLTVSRSPLSQCSFSVYMNPEVRPSCWPWMTHRYVTQSHTHQGSLCSILYLLKNSCRWLALEKVNKNNLMINPVSIINLHWKLCQTLCPLVPLLFFLLLFPLAPMTTNSPIFLSTFHFFCPLLPETFLRTLSSHHQLTHHIISWSKVSSSLKRWIEVPIIFFTITHV